MKITKTDKRIILDFIERDFIDKEAFLGSRNVFFSPIDYPTHYDSVYLPTRYKNKFKNRLDNFHKELEKTGITKEVLDDLMNKLKIVYERSISKTFNLDKMKKCKDITDKLDIIRKEKFEDVLTYFDSTKDLITEVI